MLHYVIPLSVLLNLKRHTYRSRWTYGNIQIHNQNNNYSLQPQASAGALKLEVVIIFSTQCKDVHFHLRINFFIAYLCESETSETLKYVAKQLLSNK